MAIVINFLDAFDVFLQIQQNLRGLQFDIRRLAIGWKSRAQAGSVPFPELKQQFVTGGNSFAVRIQWVSELRADSVKRQRLLDMLAKLDIPEQDIIDKASDLNTVVNQIRAQDPLNYAQLITVCDQIIAAVPARVNLWPE